jgi:succinate---hydroxymethylglutarate CoA-transferase
MWRILTRNVSIIQQFSSRYTKNVVSHSVKETHHFRTCTTTTGAANAAKLLKATNAAAPESHVSPDSVPACGRGHDGPLHGIQILDLSRIAAGPYCTQSLSDMGANVWKIERPNVGDDTRSWRPPHKGGESAYFMSLNGGKQSICIDISTEKGRQIVHQLSDRADVLVENMQGKLQSMGLDYDTLSVSNPRLVYASLTGFGKIGPYSDRPGYDMIVSGMGGMMSFTGEPNGPPIKPGVAITDITTGLVLQSAILAALVSRSVTGRGQLVDTSLFETQIASLMNVGSAYLIGGMEAKKWGTAHASIVPYQAFETKDGWLCLAAANDRQFQRLCQLMGMPELCEDERFITNALRVQHRQELLDILEKRFKEHTLSHWLDVIDWRQIPSGPVNSMKGVFEDPQTQALGMIQKVQHPTAGEINLVAPPMHFSESPTSLRTPPPLLGQHTRDILRSELDLSDTDIDDLHNSGVIQTNDI